MPDEGPETEVDDATELEDDEIGSEALYSLSSYGADYPVDGLIKRLNEDTIFVPDWQRLFVWKRPQASRFIESLLLGLPVPGIFLAKELGKTQRNLVVDGQQRLRSLKRFYDGEWESQVFTLKGVSSQFEGQSYKTLSKADRRRLDDSLIHATIVKQDSPEEDESSIYMIFERINTGGTPLSPQEIRSTVSRGSFNNLIGELNLLPEWRSIYGPVNRRKKDEEMILRFFALKFALDDYERPMKAALNDFMHENREYGLVSESDLRRTFAAVTRLAVDALGATGFRPGRALNAAVLDSVLAGLSARLDREPSPSIVAIKAAYQGLLADPSYFAAYTKSTSDDEQVRARVGLAIQAFSGT